MQKIGNIVVGILAVCVMVYIFKDLLLKASFENSIEVALGEKITIKRFRVGLVKNYIDIRGMTVLNRTEDAGKTMVDISKAILEYDRYAAIKGILHIKNAVIDVNEVSMVRFYDGTSNLDSLNIAIAEKKQIHPDTVDRGAVPKISVDNVQISIKNVYYKKLLENGSLVIEDIKVDLVCEDKSVTSINKIFSIIFVTALKSINVDSFGKINVESLERHMSTY